VLPAIVIVPVRAPLALAATVKVTDPLPLPDAPLVMLSHDALLEAVHAQLAAVVTFTAGPAPPDAVAE
jgi:hypothetical protein